MKRQARSDASPAGGEVEGEVPGAENAVPARAKLELPGWNVSNLQFSTFRVTLIAKVIDRLTIRRLAERGELTYAEWRVLARLGTMPDGGTVGQVADLAWVDRAEVSRAARSLEERGYTRRRENPNDLRTPILYLTKTGQKLYKATLKERVAFHESLLVDLSPEERVVLDELLSRIGERLAHLVKT